jgi:hypothetical protein
MKKITAALLAIVIGSAITTSSAIAGPAADELGTCLSDNTTGKERKDLARWIFVGMSAHPDMQGLSNVTDANREGLDRMMATIVTRLMTENCRSQAKLAMEKEGAASFQSAFGAIGKLAMQELMSNPKVNSSFSNYSKYIDSNKINSVFSNK